MEILKNITAEDQKMANASIPHFKSLSNSLKGEGNGVKIKIQATGELITIPKKALSLLSIILSNMAEGKSITIVPSESEISTQQAADMLNVSRPYFVKLLESGAIPFKKVGSHRRILLTDLLNYEKQLSDKREHQLRFLANQAQELNLGYE